VDRAFSIDDGGVRQDGYFRLPLAVVRRFDVFIKRYQRCAQHGEDANRRPAAFEKRKQGSGRGEAESRYQRGTHDAARGTANAARACPMHRIQE
jgi:hypothetical protein